MGKHAINWFEIPAVDFDRALKFYGQLFGSDLFVQEMQGFKMGFFPMEQERGNVGGAVCAGPNYTPSMDGTLVYLNGGEDLTEMLNRVEPAGGKVLVPKTEITPEYGYFAMFMDTEGNKVGLHSEK